MSTPTRYAALGSPIAVGAHASPIERADGERVDVTATDQSA